MANLPPIDPKIDPYGYLGILKISDQSIARLTEIFPNSPACSDTRIAIHVLSKDIPINQEKNTWARVYLPRNQEFDSNIPTKKLPTLVYYHGGGFILGSAKNTKLHEFCLEIASVVPAVIVSAGYRLAPEHRLPAAYEDCLEALYWVKNTEDEWLTKFADLSKCFLMGGSAGGNIVYHVGLRVVASHVENLMPVKIKGLILQQPFFGGVQRTPSELRLASDKCFPYCVSDVMWDLALPLGVDRDHEYSNPRIGIKSHLLQKIKSQGWKVLVTGCDGDPMIDRQFDIVKMFEESGIQVVGEFEEGGFHGIDFSGKSRLKVIAPLLKDFIISSSF